MTEHYHHGNLRNDLITAGLKMLTRDGVASFSLRRLSSELGVSHTAAYRHFKKKEDLLRAIVIKASSLFKDALANAVPPGTDGEEALIILGKVYVHFFIENPEILYLFSMIPNDQNIFLSLLKQMSEDEQIEAGIAAHSNLVDINHFDNSSAFGIFRNIASVAQSDESYRALSEPEILLGFWSKVHGMATLLVTQKYLIPEDQRDATIDRVIRTPF
jgi:AcrR family transcriptional regulator